MSTEFLFVLGLSTLPAIGNLAGGLLSEWLRPSRAFLNKALHAAAGVILAVVAVEVMPRALGTVPAWLLATALLAGGGTYLLIEAAIHHWQSKNESGEGARAWMVYVAVTADLVGDGLLIGAGAAVSTELAIILALGQVLADIPEGFSVLANFRDKGASRAKRLALSASFIVPVVSFAMISYFTLRDQDAIFQMSALVFVAGLYLLAAVEDMLQEAHDSADDTRWSAFCLIAGFALFLLVSQGLA